ncbi:MAG: SDR family NAD(P)-dependent oxidoreductase [Ilumatobacteraceae bacterium]
MEPTTPAAPDSRRLPGKRVVITGGARGIGAEIARTYRREGAEVVVLDLPCPQLAAVAAEVDGYEIAVDLTDADAAARAVTEAIGLLRGIDVLVNNAGILRTAPLLEMTIDNWDATFAVNVRAMFVTTQVAARRMIAQGGGGVIVNMASMGGKLGSPNQAHYAASKAAVISLTRVAAMELGEHQIRVNCICPGYVLTEMGAATRTPEMVAGWSSKSPLGRLAETSDVANMALFLASGESSYCTGQAMNVSGGMVMH